MDGVSAHRDGTPAKLVLWAGSFEPAGTQRFLVELLRRMDRGRFAPIVFSTLAEGELLPEVEAMGVPVHEFGTGRRALSAQTVRDLSGAAAFLRREKVDILSCMLGLTTLVGPFVGRAAGVPVVVNNQRNMSYWLRGGARESIYGFVSRRVVDAIVVNSAAAANELSGRFRVPESKIRNVGVGTDLERIARAEPAEELKRELGLGDSRVVGVVAKLSPVKGHRHFLEAAASVSRAYGDVRFLVVGDGPERARLERTAGELGISGKVRFLGVRDDVPAVLKLMDVLVLSSLSEGSPNVVLEGMASGVPIVGTRVGGVPELVEDGVSGLLVDPGDVPAMSNAVLALLTDPDRARAMGEKGRTRATEDYDINRVVVRIEDVFSDLLKRARGRRGHASEERDGGGV
ncbi:MAG: glycosyltransferase [Candidatus Eisenbacteria bacterium]